MSTFCYINRLLLLLQNKSNIQKDNNYNMYQGKKMVQPPYLKAGDKVALVSPAYWVPQEALQMAAEVIKSWGLQPVIGPNTNNLNVNAYAGTADERAADLLWALEDDTIKAVMVPSTC